MTVMPGNAQHIGSREEQQDAFAFSDVSDKKFIRHGGVLAVLADGMGGLADGKAASTLAVRTLMKEYEAKSKTESVPDALARSVLRANGEVNEMARASAMEGNIGTTIAAAVVHQDGLYWFSAGDSRIYLFRDGELSQITVDHTFALTLGNDVAEGRLSPENAARHPERSYLISFLGLRSIDMTDFNSKPFLLRKNDRILLCSDGLYGTISEREIMEEMLCAPDVAAERLVEKALGKGKRNQDNITVLVMDYSPAAERTKTKYEDIDAGNAFINKLHINQLKKNSMEIFF